MSDLKCHTLVIGAGPGGYVAAIRAGQLGLDTIIVERQYWGGTCLNVGCIPSKALIHVADEYDKVQGFAKKSPLGISLQAPTLDLKTSMAWKDGIVAQLTGGVSGLLKKAGVRKVLGTAQFIDGKTVEVDGEGGPHIIRAENIIIATGSVSAQLPHIPFGGDVISSSQALALTELPKTLSIIGAGYIGMELGMAFAKLGTKVTIIEMADSILPSFDAQLSAPVGQRLKALGVDLHLGAKALGFDAKTTALTVEASGKSIKLPSDKVLVTIGRRPALDALGLESLLVDMDGEFIKIDTRCRTSMSGIYAIGDVTGNPMLAHRAMAQGEMVAEILAGEKRAWDKTVIPAVCFTDPEIVTVGLSEDEAIAAGYGVKVESFPFLANGRAKTMEAEGGFVRIIARAEDHLVLGVQAAGQGVSELSSYFAMMCEMGARLEDIAGTIHAHPTLGEAVQETALKALGKALHI